MNGRPVQAGAREDTGQMLVPVEAGANRVQITFVRTWDRTAGGWISLFALVLVLVSLKLVAPASRRPFAEGTAAETGALPEL